MTETKNIKKETKASDTNQTNIVMIPINKIKPCRWGTGIRDKEKYEQMKENIKIHGMRNSIHVRPVENGFYEVYDGDHRLRNAKEEKWEQIACIIDENISDEEAWEICVSTNLTQSAYNPVQLENIVSEKWNSGSYKSKTQLGNKIGLSDTWVGLLIKAKELREKSKLSLDASISSRCILDADILQNEDDKIRLLTLVKEGIRKPSEIKEYAEFLSKASDVSKKLIFEGVPLEKISEYQPKKIISKSKKTYIKTPVIDLSEIYKVLNGLQDHIALIKDPEQKEEAINYIKFYAGLFLQILCKEGKMHRDVFKDLVKRELGIDESQLHHFDGLNTRGVDWWLKDFGTDETEGGKENEKE